MRFAGTMTNAALSRGGASYTKVGVELLAILRVVVQVTTCFVPMKCLWRRKSATLDLGWAWADSRRYTRLHLCRTLP